MPKPQIDNTAVKRPLHPEDYPDLIGPPAPKRHDTGYIIQDYSNPFQRAAQKWSSAYLNSSFANSPFMDVMRWIPGLNYVEKILTAQPVSEEENMGFMTPVKIGKMPVTSEPFQDLVTDINTGRKDAVNFLKSDAVKSSEAHNVALAKRAGFGDILTENRVIPAGTPMQKPDLPPEKLGSSVWIGTPEDGFYINDNLPIGGFMDKSPGFPETDMLVINPAYNNRPQASAFHETLHRSNYGDTPRSAEVFKKYSLGQLTDKELLDFNRELNKTDLFYHWKTKKLVDPYYLQKMDGKNVVYDVDYVDYLTNPREFGVHAAEMGYNAGLKPGQPYPGKQSALQTFFDILDRGDDRIKFYNWRKPKRVWDALTGKYFALPIIGLGSGAAAVSATQKTKEQQTQ